MNKHIICVLIAFTTQVWSSTENKINICRMSANFNSEYAIFLDMKLLRITKDMDTISDEIYQSRIKAFISSHEDHKDKQYKGANDYYDNLIKNRKMDILTAETEKNFMLAGIDLAHNEVLLSFTKYKSLGRTKDYYVRKIYDACMN